MTIELGFYGDDFTGSTDALESLELGDIRSVLFLRAPTADDLDRFGEVRAVGIAGTSRAATPTEMTARLPAQFESLVALGPRLVHYKVCSTFDSAPHVGSIGRALEIGLDVTGSRFVPIVVGMPALGRHVAFGNLFARGGTTTHRLDRHPTMSCHPITPMGEADLLRHLAEQTDLPIALIDVTVISAGADAIAAEVRTWVDRGHRVIVFDTIDNGHLRSIGQFLSAESRRAPLFVVGSSGVGRAVALSEQDLHTTTASTFDRTTSPVEQIVVMSGSASPVTAQQISWAELNGFRSIRMDPLSLLDRQDHIDELHERGVEAWSQGASVVFYSARGPDDPYLNDARSASSSRARSVLHAAQADIVARMIRDTDVRRLCISGGDTCGHVVQSLRIDALTLRATLDPGGPLCVAHSSESLHDGLEFALKGGQIGTTDYFAKVRDPSRGREQPDIDTREEEECPYPSR